LTAATTILGSLENVQQLVISFRLRTFDTTYKYQASKLTVGKSQLLVVLRKPLKLKTLHIRAEMGTVLDHTCEDVELKKAWLTDNISAIRETLTDADPRSYEAWRFVCSLMQQKSTICHSCKHKR
jgi:hypothetical protein